MPKSSTNESEYGAIFDAKRIYRYLLWRKWDESLPRLCFVMLNPSTADEIKNDPTIARCVGFADRWGFGSLEVVNAFAYRATDSSELKRAKNPVGKLADRYIQEAVTRSDQVVVAWGNWGSLNERHVEMNALLKGADTYCFGITNQSQPKHPLYLRNDAALVRYEAIE
jgi:hypothetical protein